MRWVQAFSNKEKGAPATCSTSFTLSLAQATQLRPFHQVLQHWEKLKKNKKIVDLEFGCTVLDFEYLEKKRASMWGPNFIYLFIFMILPHKLKSFKKIKEENYIRMIEYKREEQPIFVSLCFKKKKKNHPKRTSFLRTPLFQSSLIETTIPSKNPPPFKFLFPKIRNRFSWKLSLILVVKFIVIRTAKTNTTTSFKQPNLFPSYGSQLRPICLLKVDDVWIILLLFLIHYMIYLEHITSSCKVSFTVLQDRLEKR